MPAIIEFFSQYISMYKILICIFVILFAQQKSKIVFSTSQQPHIYAKWALDHLLVDPYDVLIKRGQKSHKRP